MGFLKKNLGLGKVALIKKWLEERGIVEYQLDEDFRISSRMINTRIEISGNLPEYINFKSANNFLFIGDEKTTSLRGCPEYVFGTFMINECRNLKTLNGCPKEVCGSFYVQNNGIEIIGPYPAFPQQATTIYLFGNPVATNLVTNVDLQKMFKYIRNICKTDNIFLI